MSAKLVPFDCEGESVSCHPLSLRWVLAILGIPWLIGTSLQSLPPLSYHLLLCVTLKFLSALHLLGHLSLYLRPTVNPGVSHSEILNLTTSVNTLYLNKVTFTDSGGYNMDISFGGFLVNPLKFAFEPPKFTSFPHTKQIYIFPIFPKVSANYNINSKSKISSR